MNSFCNGDLCSSVPMTAATLKVFSAHLEEDPRVQSTRGRHHHSLDVYQSIVF